MEWEMPDVQAEFGKQRGDRNQISNICWLLKHIRDFQKKY